MHSYMYNRAGTGDPQSGYKKISSVLKSSSNPYESLLIHASAVVIHPSVALTHPSIEFTWLGVMAR